MITFTDSVAATVYTKLTTNTDVTVGLVDAVDTLEEFGNLKAAVDVGVHIFLSIKITCHCDTLSCKHYDQSLELMEFIRHARVALNVWIRENLTRINPILN